MTTNPDSPVHRTVTIERIASGEFAAVNSRGGKVMFGTGSGSDFTPTELLLAAIGGCTSIDVDILTSRRAEPEGFEVRVDADKVRDDNGNRLTGIEVTFRIAFPAGEQGDAARAYSRTWSASHTTGCARWAGLSRSARPSAPGSGDPRNCRRRGVTARRPSRAGPLAAAAGWR
ncbi:MAG TPA: OsmC family protein [Streptosporangiaceae bacterium]|nr:OsmC family protein [Streptosporangiaceae bacterium]